MYADRYAKRSFNPGSMGMAVAINGALIAALVFSSPQLIPKIATDFVIESIPLPMPPPPEPKALPKQAKMRPTRPSSQPIVIPVVPTYPDVTVDLEPAGDPGMSEGAGTGGTVPLDPPKPPPPVMIGAQVDQRYFALLQPIYPGAERRAGRQGTVTVRVLIGVDGRVKQIERLSATSDAFYEVTMRQALAKWRLKPATRDGVPVEGWKTMTLRFQLEDGG